VGVASAGEYAYAAAGPGGLQVVDVSNADSLTLRGRTEALNARDVVVDGSYAYVTADRLAFVVTDISNPSSPLRRGAVGLPGAARRLSLKGQ